MECSRKSFIIWGAAGHAKVLRSTILRNGDKISAFVDNSKQALETFDLQGAIGLHGAKELERFLISYSEDTFYGAIAIGGGDGLSRTSILKSMVDLGIHMAPVIDHSAIIELDCHISDGCQLLAGSILGAGTRLGQACILNHNVVVDHECEIGHAVHFAPNATLCGCVKVGDGVFVGAGATILPRVLIGEKAVIGAGAVVVADVMAGETVVGIPARVRSKD